MSDFDAIPDWVEAGTLEYWKYRARQWQKRCQRSEAEKTELISELAAAQAELSAKPVSVPSDRAVRHAAIRSGDVSPGVSSAPRGL